MREAPAHIVEELKRYDRDLDIRWSPEYKSLVLERKTKRELLPKPVQYTKKDGVVKEVPVPENSERMIQWKRSAAVLKTLDCLDRRLFWWLYGADTSNFKTPEHLAREVDYRMAKAKEKEKAKRDDDIKHQAYEQYDHMKWISGERFAVGG